MIRFFAGLPVLVLALVGPTWAAAAPSCRAAFALQAALAAVGQTNTPSGITLISNDANPAATNAATNAAPATNAPPQTTQVPAGASPAPDTSATPAPAPTSPTIPTTIQTPVQPAPPAAAPAAPPGSTNTASTATNTPTYSFGQPSSWVRPIDPDSIPASETTDADGGVDYILIDDQQIMDPQSSFTHYTLRLTNEQGLETGADLRAEFDPNYQTLTVHWLKVKRDGVWSDRLRADTFQLLHREENLESQMLDGRYSIACHLPDVRVGDLVDFAYTVTGANPIFGGKFVSSFLTGFPRPVRFFSNTLTLAPGRDIHVKSFGGAPEPTRTTQPDQSVLLTWREENLPATLVEARTSPWYDVLGWVQLSEFDSWQEVADWGRSIFALDDPPTDDLEQEISTLKNSSELPESRALAAIHFVQNDIRYLGIEMGPNSYKPTPAAQVLAHRFGDCKDKTQLCVVMLRALGIDATPALVNSTRQNATEDLLPSPLAFDHAIVQLTLDGETYWVDLTRTGQTGRLRDLAIDDFGRALLLKAGTATLTPVIPSRASLPQVTVDETYKVPAVTAPGTLLLHSVYKGSAAEAMRSTFGITTHEEMQKAYLAYFGRVYPQIKVETPLRSQDFPDDNRFEVWQDYTVPGLWTRDGASVPYKAEFVPFSIVGAVGSTTPTPRTAPYRLDYPTDVTENVEIDLFDKWSLDSLPSRIETPNFLFTELPSLEDSVMRFQYHYQTLTPDVPPSGIAEYNDKIARVRNELECHLTYTPGMSPSRGGPLQLNVPGATVVGTSFGIALLLAIGLCFVRRSDDGDDYRHYEYAQYEGVGGWLVVVCISIILNLLIYGRVVYLDLTLILDQTRWDLLTKPGASRYDPNWATALLFEGSGSVFIFVILLLAGLLLLLKRFIFPYVMIAFLLLNLGFQILDHALVSQISTLVNPDASPYPPRLFQTLVSCAIWIPYFLVSKRVKATFRE